MLLLEFLPIPIHTIKYHFSSQEDIMSVLVKPIIAIIQTVQRKEDNDNDNNVDNDNDNDKNISNDNVLLETIYIFEYYQP